MDCFLFTRILRCLRLFFGRLVFLKPASMCYQIVDVEKKVGHEVRLRIRTRGRTPQWFVCSPADLVLNVRLLSCFSPFDVRAITFYALQPALSMTPPVTATIIGQEFSAGKTTFVLKYRRECIRKTAQALYQDKPLLEALNRQDLMVILTTAIQEQAADDWMDKDALT